MKKVYEARTFLKEQGICSDTLRDKIVSELVKTAEKISNTVVSVKNKNYNNTDRKIDK